MKIRNARLLAAETQVQLQYDRPITSIGAAMTLPAAVADLMDWITDSRKFVSQQHADWQQVMDDFTISAKRTGPRLASHVETFTLEVENLFPMLIVPVVPVAPASLLGSFLRKLLPCKVADTMTYSATTLLEKLILPPVGQKRVESRFRIAEDVRAGIRILLEQLEPRLGSDAAILAAWRDLCTSADNVKTSVDVVAFRRDTLVAIAQRRNLDVLGPFGLFSDLSRLIGNSLNAVQEELDREAGIDHIPAFSMDTSKEPLWRRLQLCDNVLTRMPDRGDCIIWLRLEPATLPRNEVSHGQVTFYNAQLLTSAIGHPEAAGRFSVPPTELLNLTSREATPLRQGEFAWDSDWRQAYARVELPDIEVHAAESSARSMVEALKAANHPAKNTWLITNGAVGFLDGKPFTLLQWGPKDDAVDMYYPDQDRFAFDIEQMTPNRRTLDATTLHDLEDVVALNATLALAADEGARATVVAAVRAIEHVNAWTTAGKQDWADFATHYFKKAQSRSRILHLINSFSILAIKHCVGELGPDPKKKRRISEIRLEIEGSIGPHLAYDRIKAAGHIAELRKVYADADHRLARGLGEVEGVLSTPGTMRRHLESEGETFDRQLGRLKRLRNCAVHGGPVSEAGCESVSKFALTLAYRCMDESMRALLTGESIQDHMRNYRTDSLARYNRIISTGPIEDFFTN